MAPLLLLKIPPLVRLAMAPRPPRPLGAATRPAQNQQRCAIAAPATVHRCV
jgi:hypothetical protein